jgi:hypothetical protein
MIKNSLEALQEMLEKLLVDLEQNNDCSEWDCSKCPYRLDVYVEDPRYGILKCSWILLKSSGSKILRRQSI